MIPDFQLKCGYCGSVCGFSEQSACWNYRETWLCDRHYAKYLQEDIRSGMYAPDEESGDNALDTDTSGYT